MHYAVMKIHGAMSRIVRTMDYTVMKIHGAMSSIVRTMHYTVMKIHGAMIIIFYYGGLLSLPLFVFLIT